MDRKELLKALFNDSKEFDRISAVLYASCLENGHLGEFNITKETVGPKCFDLFEQWSSLQTKMTEYVDIYRAMLTYKTVSRCPFTGETVEMDIDLLGIDGLWWNSESPIRGEVIAPSTFFAFDGAMQCDDQLEDTPFEVKPGPDIPFVIPSLLEKDNVKAVISELKVGKHTGYLIVYYSDPFLYYEPRVNDWGTERYWEPNPLIGDLATDGKWISLDPLKSERDFDLLSWIQCGKLLWLEPEDPRYLLHTSVKRCPFIHLSGETTIKTIIGQTVKREAPTVYQFSEFKTFKSRFTDNELEQLREEIERGES